jgi:hypothetical protein
VPVTLKADPRPLPVLSPRLLDVAVIVVGAVPALALGAPVLGYCVGAAGWILSRLAQVVDRRFTARVEDPVRRAGVNLFEAFGRIWLLAAAIIVAALAGNHKDGLTAALVIFAAYSIAFIVRLIGGAVAAADPAPAGPLGSGPENPS